MSSTSDLDGATDRGLPNAYASTPGEFAARWNARSEEDRQAMLVRLNDLQAADIERWSAGLPPALR